jgi:hypothetical protein
MKRTNAKLDRHPQPDPMDHSIGTRLAAEMRRDFRDVPEDEANELTRKVIAGIYGAGPGKVARSRH